MTRDQIILLLQPYKNGLMRKKALGGATDRFLSLLCKLCEKYPRLRFNVAMPGYVLECANPLTLSQLRDNVKRGGVEWLCMGYTEPFLHFSPHWLSGDNIALGAKVITELTGAAPTGFTPPFSNWEPAHIDLLNAAGLQYAVVSNALLDKSAAGKGGYWITEYTGRSVAVFPCHSYSPRKAPQSVMKWIDENFIDPAKSSQSLLSDHHQDNNRHDNNQHDENRHDQNKNRHDKNQHGKTGQHDKKNHHDKTVHQNKLASQMPRLFTIKYLYPLEEDAETAGAWIEQAAAEIDKHILELQPMRFKDAFGDTSPLGLQYFPAGLIQPHGGPADPYFLNKLHCYDQISVMQRKLMDVCDAVGEVRDAKKNAALKKTLFFAQDINRFLPSEKSGFVAIDDRLWTYAKLIDVEREIYEQGEERSGIIRLGDFLRNGYKSVIIANSALKLYIDHKFGAQIYEIDFVERAFNACAAYNKNVGAIPRALSPRESCSAFRDKIFISSATVATIADGTAKDSANFADSQFEYIFKNSPQGVKVLLNCIGGFIDEGDRHCPLSIDKVFGLEKDAAVLSFSYKLANPTLAGYAFTFAIEWPLALPGARRDMAHVYYDKKKTPVAGETVIMENVTEWQIEDEHAGAAMEFVTQKKCNVIIAPRGANEGTDMIITHPVELEKNSSLSLAGLVKFKKIRAKGGFDDTL